MKVEVRCPPRGVHLHFWILSNKALLTNQTNKQKNKLKKDITHEISVHKD